MVIGNGLMAKRFSAYQMHEKVLIFASGVSDSKSKDEAAYRRERDLLLSTLNQFPDALLVYFSTCSIYDPYLKENHYIHHKLEMEGLLSASANDYLILRVSNVAGPGGNPKTIFHYIAQCILHDQPFQLWKHAFRNLIDVDDVFLLVHYLLGHGRKNEIINIAHPVSFGMPEIVRTFESYFQKHADYKEMDAGYYFHIDTGMVQSIAEDAGVHFGGNYLYRLLEKYYPKV